MPESFVDETLPAPDGEAWRSMPTLAKQVPESAPNVADVSAANGLMGRYPFGPASVWREDVSNAPISTQSHSLVAHLASTVSDRYNGIAAFNVYNFNNSYYIADDGLSTTDVAFVDCQGKGYTPDGLVNPGGHFQDVPIPAGAVPSPGTDKALSIYSPSTDQLWEFWGAVHDEGGWGACWGGRIDRVSRSPGFFDGHFGATATGLSSSGGMVRLADVQSGRIEHALSLAIPNPAIATRLSWPAQRSDGWDTHPHAVPEGTRLRLDPTIDVSALNLHPVAAMVASAAQRYGFIVVDTAGAVALIAESGASVQAATGEDPWAPLLDGVPDYRVMHGFPWDRLQALPHDYGRP
ncbi:hypothetical protein [Blastococcus sp. SYSU DS0828]